MKLKGFLATVILGMCGQVYACKCIGPGTVKASYANTFAVIHGKVISKELVSLAQTIKTDMANDIRQRLKENRQNLEEFESKYIVKVELEIIEIFKGRNIQDTVTIYTTDGGPSCGYDFQLGKEYIVYSSIKGESYSTILTESERKQNIEKENSYWTNRCTRTTEFIKSEADELKLLKNK